MKTAKNHLPTAKLLHLVESNTEKNLKISVFGGSKVNLVKFVTANVSFGKIGKICYCKYQFWEHLEKFVTANVSFGKIWF